MNFQHEMSEQGQIFYFNYNIFFNSVDQKTFLYTNKAFPWETKMK